MYPVIRERKAEIEQAYFDNQAAVEAEAIRLYEAGDEEGARAYLTNYVCESMNNLNTTWWNFAWELLGHYYDGIMINEDGTSTTLGYPTEWLEEVGYGQSSLDDIAKLSGETPAEQPEEPAEQPEAPAEQPEAPAEPSEPAVNTETSNSTAIIIGVVVVVVVAVAAWFILKNKKKQ